MLICTSTGLTFPSNFDEEGNVHIPAFKRRTVFTPEELTALGFVITEVKRHFLGAQVQALGATNITQKLIFNGIAWYPDIDQRASYLFYKNHIKRYVDMVVDGKFVYFYDHVSGIEWELRTRSESKRIINSTGVSVVSETKTAYIVNRNGGHMAELLHEENWRILGRMVRTVSDVAIDREYTENVYDKN